jgi:excisionase family DNA binding protein
VDKIKQLKKLKKDKIMESEKNIEKQSLRLLTIKDVAEILRVDTRTVRRYFSNGVIPPPIILGGSVRWRASDIQKWINDHE